MNEKQKKIIGQIYYLANDKRGRVLLDDQIAWLEEKMKHIKRLSKKLPMIKPKTDERGVMLERL